jgi:hypothetical protein
MSIIIIVLLHIYYVIQMTLSKHLKKVANKMKGRKSVKNQIFFLNFIFNCYCIGFFAL